MTKRKHNIWFTSDWHLMHANVMQFANRPFKDVFHMEEELIRKHNNVVKPGDIVYNLGDFIFKSNEGLSRVLSQLNGTQILLLGNHDKGFDKYLDAGFDFVTRGAMLNICNEQVTVSHYPLLGTYRENTTNNKHRVEGDNWHGESKWTEQCFSDLGQFHLHGHIHAPNKGKSEVKLGRQWDVGVDGNNYTPVSISQVESWIHSVKQKETK